MVVDTVFLSSMQAQSHDDTDTNVRDFMDLLGSLCEEKRVIIIHAVAACSQMQSEQDQLAYLEQIQATL